MANYYEVTMCSRCGYIEEHIKVKATERYSYEADRPLTEKEIKEAVKKGNMQPTFIRDCSGCIDSPTYWEE